MLSDAALVSAGYPFRGKLPENVVSSVLAVQMKDVCQDDGVRWHSCLPVNLTGKKKPEWLEVGDILFVVRGNANYSVLVDRLPPGGEKAVASPYFYRVRTNNDELTPEYLVWWLNQSICQRYFEKNAEGSFTKNVRRSVLENAPLAIPSLDKQRTIALIAQTLKRERSLLAMQVENTRKLEAAIAQELVAAEDHLGLDI